MSEHEGQGASHRAPARGVPPRDGEVAPGAARPERTGSGEEHAGASGPSQPVPAAAEDLPGAEATVTDAASSLRGAAAAEGEVGALRRDLAERNDQLLRLAADFENFRRRKNQELADRARYAAEEATRVLLPVLDNLRRAVDHLPAQAGLKPGDDGPGQLQEGLRMVVLQFEQALGRIGVEPVETVGAPFDPSIHEAIGGEESDAVERDTVVAEVRPGYRLHDRLIRPALVRVAHPRHLSGS
jgi:molecular chaperone GrpE